jgi:probable rRNA maturation factor
VTAARTTVDLVLDDARWKGAGLAEVAERAARAAIAAAGLDPDDAEVSLLAASDARMAELNRAHRGREGATNVLSWPAVSGDDPAAVQAALAAAPREPGEALVLGDLALGYETCAAEAAERGLGLADHVAHLVVHGVLHLLGHDHEEDGEAARMEALEVKTLASLGVGNPY